MKTKLTMMVAMAAACAATQLTAMPTKEEMKRAEPVVKERLASERAALKSGRKTRSQVAVAAMKLADEADTDAAKLLLMKGAFVLYVRDGNLEKAVETMKALKATIPDIPPQSVTNIIEAALLEVSKKEDGAPLYKLLDESKADIASIGASSMVVKERNSIASILKGMIKVPGGDLWLSETELTQGQWEAVMGNNPSLHKGVNLPVENISRDECDIFLEKLNQTKEVQASQFEFCLPGRAEWAGAARAGNPDLIPWIKPGVAGELVCGGKGTVNTTRQTILGSMMSSTTCSRCGGTGKTVNDPCKVCSGRGYVRKTIKVKVKIPAGIDNGQAISLTGMGEPGTGGGPAGDLLVSVRVRKHAVLKRDGFDVYLDKKLSFVQAALGDTVQIPTLSGKVELTIPEGTQSGAVFKLRGLGIQKLQSTAKGDEYVTVTVETPRRLTTEQKELLKRFDAASGGTLEAAAKAAQGDNSSGGKKIFGKKK